MRPVADVELRAIEAEAEQRALRDDFALVGHGAEAEQGVVVGLPVALADAVQSLAGREPVAVRKRSYPLPLDAATSRLASVTPSSRM